MICTNCGTQFEDGNAFCPNCGTPAAQPAPAPAAAQPQYGYAPQPQAQPVYGAAPVIGAGDADAAKSCMITGILAAAFSCTFFLSFLGIVFGPMGLSKAKQYVAQYNSYPAKVRVGKYLSIGGLAMGIFMTVYFCIYFLGFLIALSGR